MSSRPPIRGNHSIAVDRNLRVKSPSDAQQAELRRRSPTQHHKRSPANSRTPSPNLDKRLDKGIVRGRSASDVKSPRSAFQETTSAAKKVGAVLGSSSSRQKSRGSPVHHQKATKLSLLFKPSPYVTRKGSPVEAPPPRKPRGESEEDVDACDSELESITASLGKSKKTPRAAARPRPRSEPQTHRQAAEPPKSASGTKEPRPASPATPGHPQHKPCPSSASRKKQHHHQKQDDLLRGSLQKVLEQHQRDGPKNLNLRDIDELLTLLDSKKQQLLGTTSACKDKGVQIEVEPPLSRTPELDAEVSHAMESASFSPDDDTASTTKLPEAGAPADETGSPSSKFLPSDCEDDPLQQLFLGCAVGAQPVGSSRLERLQRLHATAKAPTDQMFSSAYPANKKKPRLGLLDPSGFRKQKNIEYDKDRRTEIAERARERESLRESTTHGRSTLSSPETVISSVSDYTAWSCPSPRSPNHVEFSYRPPPSFVPRIRLEALRSPRRSDNVQHSPDPNKAAALYSPCSAFTPRSSADEGDARHKSCPKPPKASHKLPRTLLASAHQTNKLPTHPEPQPDACFD